MLDKNAILAAEDFDFVVVDVPEWNGQVKLRGLTSRERDQFEESVGVSGTNLSNLRARLVVLCAVDDSGQRIFTDKDADALGNKNALVINRLFDAARKLSGMTNSDIEEMEKN